ncbi:hypothetical protein SERLADRAFT_444060 [Serpula lacrymans var. lacrymans S7.9]|uniref:Uncharacterized protein n=1 Tax=Serpula lacrymans var. lacrymans (strain S7.9) TaxID=578457 RepID=F8PEE0_SERL9|nr:uncharacterized protein SERLADRAFT_444060 [Serpula lacrymans var. lacrymans S7.9]EGO18472.1 hypothetical protein SERLADRAFT_444060 [Serpula lacrymans var. lacrymans S7.9]
MCAHPLLNSMKWERQEHNVFTKLLKTISGLKECLMEGSEEEAGLIAKLITKGAADARSDNTKSLKSAVLDWINPHGQPLIPPLARNIKSGHGYNHKLSGGFFPAGLDWPNSVIKEKFQSGELAISGGLFFFMQATSMNQQIRGRHDSRVEF